MLQESELKTFLDNQLEAYKETDHTELNEDDCTQIRSNFLTLLEQKWKEDFRAHNRCFMVSVNRITNGDIHIRIDQYNPSLIIRTAFFELSRTQHWYRLIH